MNFKERGIVLLLLICAVVSTAGNYTYAWFMKTISSREYKIITTDINLSINGNINDFEIQFGGGPYSPGNYIGDSNGYISYEIVNKTSVPLLYTSGFVYGNGENFILNGMVVEKLIREIYNSSGKKVLSDTVINNYNIQGKYAYLTNYIDTQTIKGTNGKDGKISLKEFMHFQNKALGNFKGFTLGMLKPNCKEIIKYKVRFDPGATGANYENKSLNFTYEFYVGQKSLESFRKLSRDNVINVGTEVDQQFFNFVTNLRYGEIESAYYNIQ